MESLQQKMHIIPCANFKRLSAQIFNSFKGLKSNESVWKKPVILCSGNHVGGRPPGAVRQPRPHLQDHVPGSSPAAS